MVFLPSEASSLSQMALALSNFRQFFSVLLASKTNSMLYRHRLKNWVPKKADFEMHKWHYHVEMPNATISISQGYWVNLMEITSKLGGDLKIICWNRHPKCVLRPQFWMPWYMHTFTEGFSLDFHFSRCTFHGIVCYIFFYTSATSAEIWDQYKI